MKETHNEPVVARCKACGKVILPPAWICPQCNGTVFEDLELSKVGTIRTYTTIRIPPLGFEGQCPYDIAIIEMPEGINIPARLSTQGQEPKIGNKVSFINKEAGAYWFKLLSE